MTINVEVYANAETEAPRTELLRNRNNAHSFSGMGFYLVTDADQTSNLIACIVYEESPEEAIRMVHWDHMVSRMIGPDTRLTAVKIDLKPVAGVSYVVAVKGWDK